MTDRRLPKLYRNIWGFAYDYYRENGESQENSIDLASRDAQAILYRYVDPSTKGEIDVMESFEGHEKSIKTR